MIDTHTADGLKVALEQRPAGMTDDWCWKLHCR
jgi:hypothetical protein